MKTVRIDYCTLRRRCALHDRIVGEWAAPETLMIDCNRRTISIKDTATAPCDGSQGLSKPSIPYAWSLPLLTFAKWVLR
jgi:hypothetical protein